MAIIVEAIPAAPPSTGLIQSARTGSDIRWSGEPIGWRSERCPGVQGFSLCAELPDEDIPPVVGDTEVHVFPQAYRVRDFCGTRGGELDSSRVRRQAEAVASFVVAEELWTGTLTKAGPGEIDGAPYVNPHLASAAADTVATTGAADVAERLGILEQEARQASRGQQVFLHVPIQYVTPIADKLRRVGGLLYTALDSVVVADAGYPGTGPGGTGTSWAYATGPVEVRLSPIDTIEGRTAETVMRNINRQEIWATRAFAVSFDPCVHLAADLAAAG
jgi:hypothetical protein